MIREVTDRRICTYYSDFVIATIKLAKQLLQRNYKMDNIFNAFRLVGEYPNISKIFQKFFLILNQIKKETNK